MSTNRASVTKSSDYEAYHIRVNHEWATICIKAWPAGDDDTRHIGEILIYSSFGSWAHQWGHLGKPFKPWLAYKADKHYMAGKLMGDERKEFDGEASVKGLRQSLLEARRCGDLTRNDARSLWDYVDDYESELETSSHDFVQALRDADSLIDWKDVGERGPFSHVPGRGAQRFLEEPWEYIRTTLNRQFSAFWDEIWMVFREHLQQELELIAA